MAQESIINIKINSKQAQKSLDDTSQSVRNVDKNTRNLKEELKALKKEMQGLEVGSEKFNEIAKEAGQLEDKIGKVSAATRIYSSDTLKLDQTIGVIQGVAGAYGAVQGIMALTGIENEKLLEVMVRLQAVQSITNGINAVAIMLNKTSASGMFLRATSQKIYNTLLGQTNVATATNVTVTGAQAVATTSASFATRALGAAMNALPILALIGGISLIVSALFEWGDAADEVADGMDGVNDRQLSIKKVSEDVAKILDTQAKIETENLQENIRLKEQQLRLINLKKDKTETEIKEELKLKTEILDINKQIVDTQKRFSDINLVTLMRQQQELQREYVMSGMELDELFEKKQKLNISERIPIAQLENTLTRLRVAIQAELDITEKISNLKSTDFKSEIDFIYEVTALREELALQTIESEKEFSNLRKMEGDKTLKKYKIDVNEHIAIYKNFKDKSQELNEEYLKQELKIKEVQSKRTELDNQKELLAEEEKLRKQNKLKEKRDAQERLRRQKLLDEEQKEETVKNKLNDLTTERFLKGIDFQIEKLRQAYDKERNDIITNATQRELKTIEKQFLNLEITEEDFYTKRAKIQEDGVENLTLTEEAYLKSFEANTEKRIKLIRRENDERENLTKVQTNLILAEKDKLLTSELMLNQEKNAFIEAQDEVSAQKWYQRQLTTEEIFQQKMKGIRSKFIFERIEDETQLLNKKIDLLEIEKEKELSNEELTQVEKTKIVEEYSLKRKQLELDASETILDLNKELNEDLQEEVEDGWMKTYAAIELIGAQVMKLGDEIAKHFQIATQNAINSVQAMYATEKEEANQQLTDQEISQEEFNDKMLLLERNKEAEIKRLKLIQFNRDKKNSKAQAIISGVQAGIQAWANPGFPLALAVIPLIAAQTLVAVNNIESQQFTANRGGIVPGSTSKNEDSVSAYLTPGEAVMTKNATDMFLPLLSQMNQVGGGKSLNGTPLQSQPTKKESGNKIIKTFVTTKDLKKGMDTDKKSRLNSRF